MGWIAKRGRLRKSSRRLGYGLEPLEQRVLLFGDLPQPVDDTQPMMQSVQQEVAPPTLVLDCSAVEEEEPPAGSCACGGTDVSCQEVPPEVWEAVGQAPQLIAPASDPGPLGDPAEIFNLADLLLWPGQEPSGSPSLGAGSGGGGQGSQQQDVPSSGGGGSGQDQQGDPGSPTPLPQQPSGQRPPDLLLQPGPQQQKGIRFTGRKADVQKAYELLAKLKQTAPPQIKTLLAEMEREGVVIRVVARDSRVLGGSYALSTIDIADLLKLPEKGPARTRTSALLHELVEQYYKQKNKWRGLQGYERLHQMALGIEGLYLNSRFDSQKDIEKVEKNGRLVRWVVDVIWIHNGTKYRQRSTIIFGNVQQVITQRVR